MALVASVHEDDENGCCTDGDVARPAEAAVVEVRRGTCEGPSSGACGVAAWRGDGVRSGEDMQDIGHHTGRTLGHSSEHSSW